MSSSMTMTPDAAAAAGGEKFYQGSRETPVGGEDDDDDDDSGCEGNNCELEVIGYFLHLTAKRCYFQL